jgi:16S rRNA (guanine1207-N2)-methyltransferase
VNFLSNQYFENNNNLKKETREILFYYRGNKILLTTNTGIFSKSYVDFGTQQLLKNINLTQGTTSVLDVGCGYGVIGITIAKTYEFSKVDMIDINSRAVEITKENIIKNNVNNASCFISNIYENIVSQYDLIVSNPPIRAGKQVVHSILADAYQHLNIGGSIIVVIQKKQGAPSTMKKLKEVFGNVTVVDREKGYYILKSIK